MSAWQALLKFIEVLQGLPASVIAADRVGLRRPASVAELPMIAIAFAEGRAAPVGIGRHVALTSVAPDEWAQTTGSRCAGELRAELWAASADQIAALTSAVMARLDEQALALRTGGFADLSLKSLGPAQPATAGTGAALLMPLAFETTFESLVTAAPGGAGIIRTVHVDLSGERHESMDIR